MIARNADWYRTEAGRLRDKAAEVKRGTALQNSYLALALEYDRLANTIERRRPTRIEARQPSGGQDHLAPFDKPGNGKP